jgi:hypothetical protein
MNFERLPNESEKAYSAYQAYLTLGHERSHDRVGQKLGKSKTLIDRWASQYRWKERLKTYTSHMATVQQQAEEENLKEEASRWADRAKELKEQEWEMAEKLLAKAEDMMAFPLTKEVVRQKGEDGDNITIIEPSKWGLSDLARIVDLSTKLKRMATGLATDRSEISGVEGGPIRTAHASIIEGLEDEHVDRLLSELYNGKHKLPR